jgi:hypothetical protein
MKANLYKYSGHLIMVMMAMWKLNLLKCQMVLLELLHRH